MTNRQPRGMREGGQFAESVNPEAKVDLDNDFDKTPDRLREEATKCRQDAIDSFERCDTDGFLSQWASGLTAQLKDRQASITENGGLSDFPILLDAETKKIVSAKLVDTRYGTAWSLLDDEGKFTGQFITAFPAKTSTMLGKGFIEARGIFPAVAKIVGDGGRGLSGNAWVATVKRCDDMTAPSEIIMPEPPETFEVGMTVADAWQDYTVTRVLKASVEVMDKYGNVQRMRHDRVWSKIS
jgi:hypothetical protein